MYVSRLQQCTVYVYLVDKEIVRTLILYSSLMSFETNYLYKVYKYFEILDVSKYTIIFTCDMELVEN